MAAELRSEIEFSHEVCKIGDLIKSLTITVNAHISNFMLSFAHFFQDFKDKVTKSISYERKTRQGVTLMKTLIILDVINIGTRGINRGCRWTYS
jgi:hypothetical protein